MGSESFIATNYRKPIIRALSHPSHLLLFLWPATRQRLNTTIQGGLDLSLESVFSNHRLPIHCHTNGDENFRGRCVINDPDPVYHKAGWEM